MQTSNGSAASQLSQLSDRIGLLAAELIKVQAELAKALVAPGHQRTSQPFARYGAIRGEILVILKEWPAGLRSREIEEILRFRMGAEMGRRTHATTLSRLKREGVVREGGGYWYLA